MKNMKHLLIAVCGLLLTAPIASAQSEPDYCRLEHLTSGVRAQVDGLSGDIGFTNFALTGLDQYNQPANFMATLFYDLSAPLSFSTISGSWGSDLAGNYTGAWGINLYNRDTGVTVMSYITPSLDPNSEWFQTDELNQSISNGLYEDRLTVSAYLATQDISLFVGENNGGTGGGANVNLIDSFGGTLNTLGDIAAPLDFSPLAPFHYVELTFNDYLTGDTLNLTAYDPTGIHCSGSLAALAVPEPSGAVLLGVTGSLLVLRRRRA